MFGMMGMGGDFDDDFMGNHMNAMNMQMRSMNRMMSSLMPDPFNMLTPFDGGFQQNAMMERGHHAMPPMGGLFGFPAMPNMNRLLSADIGAPNGASFCSSSVISMSSGPDGRPQIYQATSSTKTGPGGIRETRKTVQDSSMGVKKMAIGHHIGDRAHIIEKEQDLRSGQLEERQEFVNLEEEEAEDFDREFTNKASGGRPAQRMLAIEPVDDDEQPRSHQRQLMPSQQQLQQQQLLQQQQQQRRQLPALPAPPQQHNSSTLSSPRNTSSSLSSSSAANASAANVYVEANAAANHNNNNNYTPRRAYRSHLGAAGGATARRPLRTPSSSPLATTPTNHSHSTATSPSVHPHPYNASAARRNYRPKHTKQHQQQQQPQTPPTAAAAAATATTISPTLHAAAATSKQHQPQQQDNSNN